MKRPLVGLAIVYAAGIWAGSLVACPLTVALGCAVVLFLLFLFWRRAPVLLALVFCVGFLACREAVSLRSPRDVRRLIERNQSAGLRGVVVSEPQVNDSGRARFVLRLSSVRRVLEWETAEGHVWVTGPTTLRYGDEIVCVAAVRAPEPVNNPGAFDWREWLQQRHIAFTANVGSDDLCSVLARNRGNPLTAMALRLRARFECALRCGLENEPEIAGALTAMVIGERAEIPPDTYNYFQRTGVFHVFAINGLHVGLVTAMVLLLLRAVHVPSRWAGGIAIPFLILYVWATGAHPGAVRALVMASVWLVGRMILRPADGLNNLAAAALILLVWEPLELFDGGFLLSFTVVTSIVVLTARIEARLLLLGRVDPFLPHRLVPRWRMMVDAARRMLVRLLSCSIAAWIGLVPLLATYFHLFTPSSIVANLLVIPLLMCVIATGLAATLAHAVWPWFAVTLNNASFALVSVMTWGVEWISRVPGSHLYVQAPPAWLTAVYYVFGVVLIARRIPWRWRCWSVGIGAPVVAGAVLFMAQPEESIEITALDLTDGIAIFVNLPGEQDDFLIDGGGEKILLPFLRSRGVDRLGSVIVTCKDRGHIAGLEEIITQMPVREVVVSGIPSRSQPYQDWRGRVNARLIPVRNVHAGTSWNVQQLKITALNPPSDSRSSRADDNALVMLLEYGPTRILWTSNIGESIERRLVQSGVDLHCPILIKANHTREPSGTDELLDAVKPELVVHLVNSWPVFRRSDPELAQRVKQHGARYVRSDEAGAITIHLTSHGYWFLPCRKENNWR
jgi:competence protein ComEC